MIFIFQYPYLVPPLKNSRAVWNLTSENDGHSYQYQEDGKMKLSQGRSLGGTGLMNYMVYSRGNSKDFEEWSRITKDSNWKWKNVLPYFIKSEAVHDKAIMNSSHKCLFGSKEYMGVTRDKK